MRIILFALLFASCTDESGTRHALEAEGYTDIRVGGYATFGCSSRDDTCTKFEATGPSGVRTSGVVGCGLTGCSKACTVRIR